MNSVKRKLRDELDKALFEPIEHTYGAICTCHAKTEKGFNDTLHETRAWPLFRVQAKLPYNDILSKLSQFSFKPDIDACVPCRQEYTRQVREGVQNTANFFKGLCIGMLFVLCQRFPGSRMTTANSRIDCMEHSKLKTEHGDDDFWKDHPLPENNWSYYCRIKHDQTTWVGPTYS